MNRGREPACDQGEKSDFVGKEGHDEAEGVDALRWRIRRWYVEVLLLSFAFDSYISTTAGPEKEVSSLSTAPQHLS